MKLTASVLLVLALMAPAFSQTKPQDTPPPAGLSATDTKELRDLWLKYTTANRDFQKYYAAFKKLEAEKIKKANIEPGSTIDFAYASCDTPAADGSLHCPPPTIKINPPAPVSVPPPAEKK